MVDTMLDDLRADMREYVAEGGRVGEAWNAGYALGQLEERARNAALLAAIAGVDESDPWRAVVLMQDLARAALLADAGGEGESDG